MIYDDLRDLENVREISLLELLAAELPARVGAPISVKNLRDTLEEAHETVERWLRIFERLYFSFRIPPFGTFCREVGLGAAHHRSQQTTGEKRSFKSYVGDRRHSFWKKGPSSRNRNRHWPRLPWRRH